MTDPELIEANARLEHATPEERLAFAVEKFGDDVLFTSSFGAQSAVMLHLWSRVAPHLPVVFLDTGFLFPETLRYRDELVARLGLKLRIVTPDILNEDFVARYGSDIQRRDPDFCCGVNKVAPLAPLKEKARAWISGLRRDQSKTRANVAILEREGHLVRVHPIATLTKKDIAAYLAQHDLPEHPLVAQRYFSIGCAPCTRRVEEGEDERAGRWAFSNKTECGLHTARVSLPIYGARPAARRMPNRPRLPEPIRRRAFLAGIAVTAVSGFALAAQKRESDVLRVGVMTNLTHAPLLAGLGSGRIAQALAPVRVETRLFRAGPRVCEALIGDAIDVGTAGSAAIVIHHSRHGHSLRVVTGCASGGASLVTAHGASIQRGEHLRGKRIAVTGIGTTQDVALRVYLSKHGLRDAAAGGDVTILAVSAATILDQMRRGRLDAAWLPEPWATRLVQDAGATRFIDERDLWPGRRFATAVLATHASLAHDPRVVALARALEGEVERAVADPGRARDEAYVELRRRVGNPGARSVFDAAWRFVDFTSDPVEGSIVRFGEDAHALGLCPESPSSGLFA
jgi:phosphoadenylyl-sulfate reductase (thioredoxin)